MALLFVLSSTLCGCMGFVKSFEPPGSEIPITLFDRYEVVLSGFEGRGSGFALRCDVYFLTAVPDDAPINDIPILVIDTICLSGGCLNAPVCCRMMSWTEYLLSRQDYNPSGYYGTIKRSDLWARNGVLVPVGYYTEPRPHIADACRESILSVEIRARLLDRATRKEIARETKATKLEVYRTPAG